MLAYFIVNTYIEARTSSFVSLDEEAGVCRGDSGSEFCCEVPQQVTGTFLGDTRGRWNTERGFSYISNAYAVTALGLEYTNAQWTEVMTDISEQLRFIGQKGATRDMAWYVFLLLTLMTEVSTLKDLITMNDFIQYLICMIILQ